MILGTKKGNMDFCIADGYKQLRRIRVVRKKDDRRPFSEEYVQKFEDMLQDELCFEKVVGKAMYKMSWLCDLKYNKETVRSVPLYKAPVQKRLTQNYPSDGEGEKIGTLHLIIRFKAGMDNSHMQWIKSNDDHETYEWWR